MNRPILMKYQFQVPSSSTTIDLYAADYADACKIVKQYKGAQLCSPVGTRTIFSEAALDEIVNQHSYATDVPACQLA